MRLILALGLTLFEVLVSLFIFSLLLLGLDVMELSALHLGRQAYFTDLAGQQLRNMEERLRMLGESEGLNPLIAAWERENKHILPQGAGLVSGNYPDYTITVYWGGQRELVCKKSPGEYAGCITEHFIL